MINMLPRTSRSFTWAHREVSSPWKGNCSEGTLVQADGRLARGAGETQPQASTPRTLHLTVTFDQREQVHPIKRNAHTGWLWCPYFLQTPTQSFPSGTASQTWEGLDITTRCLQGLSGQLSTPVILSIQFNPTNTSLRKGDSSWIRGSRGEWKGNNSSVSSSDLPCQTQSTPDAPPKLPTGSLLPAFSVYFVVVSSSSHKLRIFLPSDKRYKER